MCETHSIRLRCESFLIFGAAQLAFRALVQITTMSDQDFYYLHGAEGKGHVHRGPTVDVHGIGICAVFEQPQHDLRMFTKTSSMQGCIAFTVKLIDGVA